MSSAEQAIRLKFLSSVPLLQDLSTATIQDISRQMGVIACSRGDRIFTEGSEAATFYLIWEGWVKVMRDTASGHSVLFEILGPGEMLGAVAVVNEHPFPATAVAASEGKLLTLSGKSFTGYLNRYPEMQRNYSREIGTRLGQTRAWQTSISLNVEGRIAQLFLRLAERMGKREGASVRLPRLLTRQEIADMVGTTLETAIRTVSRWNKEGLVRTEEHSFVIEALDDLVALSEK